MLLSIQPVAVLAAILSIVNECRGDSFKPPKCVGDITKFPNCEKADSIAVKCSDLSKEKTIECFCTQELLNAYVGCKGEFRQCILGNTYDSSVDDMIAAWQDACGPYLSDKITTPVASPATRTLDEDTCQTIAESCGHLSASIDSCSSSYKKSAEVTSCRCQESLVSLASVCDIDGPKSCEGKTAIITSNIWEFRNCDAATDVLTTEDTATITEAPGASATEEMTSTLTFGSDSTATSTTSSGAVLKHHRTGRMLSSMLALTFIYFSLY